MGKIKPWVKYPLLAADIEELNEFKKKYVDELLRSAKTGNGAIYPMDFFIMAIYKRSIDLIDGVIELTKSWNFVAAAPLLRLHIDSLLKINYLVCCTTKKDFILEQWLENKRFDHIKDADGNVLNDTYLRNCARDLHPWIDSIYAETSKLIHLSAKHLHSVFRKKEGSDSDPRKKTIEIGVGVSDWPEAELHSFLMAMSLTSDRILATGKAWIDHKSSPKRD